MTNLIGITGKKGCGKTTASNHLVSRYGFTRISFANPLKFMLFSLGLSYEELWSDQKEAPSDLLCGQTPRHAMQALGTEWGRNLIHKDIWVSAWAVLVKKCKTPVVVDDLRFFNEACSIIDSGGKILLIERPGSELKDVHASEMEIEKLRYDEKIVNNSSLINLRYEVDKFMGS